MVISDDVRRPDNEEDEEPKSCSKDHTEEQPSIVGHCQEHENVGKPNLHRPHQCKHHTHQPELDTPGVGGGYIGLVFVTICSYSKVFCCL